jgi:hypothetical protein
VIGWDIAIAEDEPTIGESRLGELSVFYLCISRRGRPVLPEGHFLPGRAEAPLDGASSCPSALASISRGIAVISRR